MDKIFQKIRCAKGSSNFIDTVEFSMTTRQFGLLQDKTAR